MKLKGVIESGAGRGAFFSSLDWVVKQFREAMGFAPFPGTLNVRVCEDDLPKVAAFFSTKDFELIPTDPKFCAASLKKVMVDGVAAAAVFPSEDVRIHGREIIEIISHCHLKEALHLADGDSVTIAEFQQFPFKEG